MLLVWCNFTAKFVLITWGLWYELSRIFSWHYFLQWLFQNLSTSWMLCLLWWSFYCFEIVRSLSRTRWCAILQKDQTKTHWALHARKFCCLQLSWWKHLCTNLPPLWELDRWALLWATARNRKVCNNYLVWEMKTHTWKFCLSKLSAKVRVSAVQEITCSHLKFQLHFECSFVKFVLELLCRRTQLNQHTCETFQCCWRYTPSNTSEEIWTCQQPHGCCCDKYHHCCAGNCLFPEKVMKSSISTSTSTSLFITGRHVGIVQTVIVSTCLQTPMKQRNFSRPFSYF